MSQDIIPEPGFRSLRSIGSGARADGRIYLLADHLDAALAAGEDLLACRFTVAAPCKGMAPDQIRAEQAELRRFIDRVRALEMALVSRVLQARRRAAELPRDNDALKMMLGLLLAGTAGLSEAVREVGDNVEQQFTTGGGHLAYLRSRGFIDPEAACLGPLADLQVTDAFLIYGRLPLGGLLDLVAELLDKLDVIFDLYPDEVADSDEPASEVGTLSERLAELEAAVAVDALTSADAEADVVREEESVEHPLTASDDAEPVSDPDRTVETQPDPSEPRDAGVDVAESPAAVAVSDTTAKADSPPDIASSATQLDDDATLSAGTTNERLTDRLKVCSAEPIKPADAA